jgi:hypothetical protein
MLKAIANDQQYPFRIDYAFGKKFFLPNNKSVDEGDAIDFCEVNKRSSGIIGINLGKDMIKLMTNNLKISNNRILTLYRISPD